MKRVAAFAAVLCAGVLFAEEEIEYLEYVESDGYAYADTGICPNPMRTRVHAWLIPAPCPTKTVNAKYGAIFGALGVKGAFNNNKACTCHFGWRAGGTPRRTFARPGRRRTLAATILTSPVTAITASSMSNATRRRPG